MTNWDPILIEREHKTLIWIPTRLQSLDTLKKNSEIKVCNHYPEIDLFHPKIPEEWVSQILTVIYQNPQHTFYLKTHNWENAQRLFVKLQKDRPEDWLKNVKIQIYKR